MAKKKKATKKKTRRRRSVGTMTGKFQNRSLNVKAVDVLAIIGGAALNYMVINPALNRLSAKMQKEDGTPMMGEHQAKIITGVKGVASGVAAYGIKKMPKAVRMGLVGVAASSGVEMAGQLMPDKMVAIAGGTGDLFENVGATTPLIEIPMNEGGVSGADEDTLELEDTAIYGFEDTAVMGTGDVFEDSFVF